MINQRVSAALQELRSLHDPHLEIGKAVFGPKGGLVWAVDFLGVATINRSLSHLRGFCDLIDSENFICAAPLVRLQLDNCIRFSAAWLVKDPHEFARRVMDGTPIKSIKDNDGKNLTDAYCVKKLSVKRPWVGEVYGGTSGYVHLSEKHIFNAIGLGEGEGGIAMKISARDHFVTEAHYFEAISAFKEITELLFEYLREWTSFRDVDVSAYNSRSAQSSHPPAHSTLQ